MDTLEMIATIEAQFLMGHRAPSGHVDAARQTILDWFWNVDQVRQQLHVPADAVWDLRVLQLEADGLAHFTFSVAPVTYDAQGTAHEIPGWRDDPREQWGSVSISPRGVLRLATLYGRPYVLATESPAVLAHWRLVQAEAAARSLAPYNPETQAREWPERALLWKAMEAAEGASNSGVAGIKGEPRE